MNRTSSAAYIMVFLTIIAISLAVGCVGEPGESQTTQLRIGYQPSTHQMAHMTAMEKGWWSQDLAPYGIDMINDFEFGTGAPEMHAMLAGELNIAYVGAAPAIAAMDKGLDAKIVAGVQTQGSDIVLRPEIEYNNPSDLKGLKIATFPPGTIQYTLLRNWLNEHEIDPDTDLDIVTMGPGDAITAISAGRVDGVFLPHPAPTIIESEGNGRSVVSSGDMLQDHACCVLVVSGELLRENPELVSQIVQTHIRATEYNINNIDEASGIFANKTGWDKEYVLKSIDEWDGSWISDPEVIVNSTLDYTNMQYESGYISKPLTRDDLFDMSFYERVMGGE
ncbi:MAG: ABC transporter substrate-binding protein [Methanosarcinales archaeon]|nr:ABC transporter substrate-binding protein [Methanosarcinales archaeon]